MEIRREEKRRCKQAGAQSKGRMFRFRKGLFLRFRLRARQYDEIMSACLQEAELRLFSRHPPNKTEGENVAHLFSPPSQGSITRPEKTGGTRNSPAVNGLSHLAPDQGGKPHTCVFQGKRRMTAKCGKHTIQRLACSFSCCLASGTLSLVMCA